MEWPVHIYLGWQSTGRKLSLLSLLSQRVLSRKRILTCRIQQSMYIPFGKKYGTMYERGDFASMSVNGSIPVSSFRAIYPLSAIFAHNTAISSLTLGLERSDTILPLIRRSTSSWTSLLELRTHISSRHFEHDSMGLTAYTDRIRTEMDMAASPGLISQMTPWLNSTTHLLLGSLPGVKAIPEECRLRA